MSPSACRHHIRAAAAVLMLLTAAQPTIAQEPTTPRQLVDDAWWTGPMLAPSANTLPRGHVLVEPYFFDVVSDARFGEDGRKEPAPRSDGFGSLTYALYGVTDRVTLGVIPTAFYTRIEGGPDSSSLAMGDLTVHAQYRLRAWRPDRRGPAMSVVVQQAFPTGRFDRLGSRPANGTGTGAYTTTLAFFTQDYFWLPNGRILRMRVDVSGSLSSEVGVVGVSVYGTAERFQGRAAPGASIFADAAWEYSVTRQWVGAIDVTYRRDAGTRVDGNDPSPVHLRFDSSDAVGFAPAIEYNWNANVGILIGARVIARGRNAAVSITPAVAVNIVH